MIRRALWSLVFLAIVATMSVTPWSARRTVTTPDGPCVREEHGGGAAVSSGCGVRGRDRALPGDVAGENLHGFEMAEPDGALEREGNSE